jgi:hypothetical protein
MTNMSIGKYYPNICTIFMVGCLLYVVSFFIIKDLLTDDGYQKYKSYIWSLIIIDFVYLIYIAKYANHNKKMSQIDISIPPSKEMFEKSENDSDSITLSSEIDDIRLTHDIETTSNDFSIFSTSDIEKNSASEKTTDNKSTTVSDLFIKT